MGEWEDGNPQRPHHLLCRFATWSDGRQLSGMPSAVARWVRGAVKWEADCHKGLLCEVVRTGSCAGVVGVAPVVAAVETDIAGAKIGRAGTVAAAGETGADCPIAVAGLVAPGIAVAETVVEICGLLIGCVLHVI